MAYKCCACGVNKRKKQGKNKNSCQVDCISTKHWWCHACIARNYRQTLQPAVAAQENEMQAIENILFGEEIIKKKRGRPKKLEKDLNFTTKKKRFNSKFNQIVEDIKNLNENESGFSVGANFTISHDFAIIRKIGINTLEENEDELRLLVIKLAYLKIK